MDNTSLIIGKEEWCSLPDLQLPMLKARVDSGAQTSSLHAFNIDYFEKDKAKWVRFDIHPLQHNTDTVIVCSAPMHDMRKVRSSSGHSAARPVIQTRLALDTYEWLIELTLSDRGDMTYRMLLGREALAGRALIDVAQSCMMGQ